MPILGPISRRDLIRYLRRLGFEGPYNNRKEIAMLTDYIQAAMRRATYKILDDDGTYVGTIPGLQGIWANACTLTACQEELQEVLEDWLILGFRLGHEIPVVDGINLNTRVIATQEELV